jgi:hypothetical protein
MIKKEMNFAINMFVPEGFDSKGFDDKKYQQFCNQACAQYFAKVLRGEWNPKDNLKFGAVEVKADSNQPLVHQDDLK